jgi:thiamine pyrophosphokinase
MRTVIFVNGHITDYTQAAHWLRADDFLIGADGGTRHCLALGRQPHAIVGDLDSLEPALLVQFETAGVIVDRHPRAKDKTDLELAVEFAIHRGATEVLLLGALGGRLDQMLANLLLLGRAQGRGPSGRGWRAPILAAEGNQLAQVLRGEAQMTLQAPVGNTVSVMALSEQVCGITYSGLEYPLDNFTLLFGSTRGLSNVVVEQPATIRITSGVLLVVQIVDLTSSPHV